MLKEAKTGASVLGHMLINDDKLYIASGTSLSPAVYNLNTGECLNDSTLLEECQSFSPRGWELFLTGDHVIAAGKPFYAPDDISFDDPINAQKKWGVYENSITLSEDLNARYEKMIGTMMVCSYCCGSPTRVTLIKNCGCAHARAATGFYKYMLQTYGAQYSDEELVGESHRWYAIWYPKGMLEDYLLATGNEQALPHQTHGGAGAGGRHGL